MEITEIQSTESSNPLPDRPIAELWQPSWLVDVGQEVMVGITQDDGCYVILAQSPTGQWRPTTHVPVEAAKMLGRLAIS